MTDTPLINKAIYRILIVDDDEDIRINLGDILADHGFKVDSAANGDIALKKLSELRSSGEREGACDFDLCLLDFKMPGMTGAELFERMRELCPRIQAIMITAYAGDDGIQKALDAGTWKILRKPVDVDSLLELIDQVAAN